MGLRTSKFESFPAAVIKDAHQEKNSTKENHNTHNDLREELKRSGVFCLFMAVQANALVLVVFVAAPETHPIKLSLA